MEIDLFSSTDFRPIIRKHAQAKGHGEMRRICKSLQIHTTYLSQVLSGKKCFSQEQSYKMCRYLKLNPLESEYFMKLVQLERAGTTELKSYLKSQLSEINRQSQLIKNRVSKTKTLRESDMATYYSSWHYSFVRLITSIEGKQTLPEIANATGLTLSRTNQVLDFLISKGLCRPEGDKFVRTNRNTHISAQSHLSARHHINWRQKSIQLLETMDQNNLAFTAPISMSHDDFEKVKGLLLDLVGQISKIVEDSEPEIVAYLGIDHLKITH